MNADQAAKAATTYLQSFGVKDHADIYDRCHRWNHRDWLIVTGTRDPRVIDVALMILKSRAGAT